MKKQLIIGLITVLLFLIPKINFGQTIDLGAAANFVIYTTGGAVHDNASSHSHLIGDVGYYTSGDFLGFGNVNGVMRPGVDASTTSCELALQSAVSQISSTTNDYFPGLLLGNSVVFTPGVYSIPGDAVLNLDLILDAENVANAEFIIKIQGTFSTNAASSVKLINGALACNVYWYVEGVVSMATNTSMKGTVIAVNSAINMATGDSLEGRLLSTTGAITIDGITAFLPIGCGSPVLTGPNFPDLGSIVCYTIFSSDGALTNTAGTTTVIGDVGNNGIGAITGWDPADVTGTLHLIQDPSTIQAAVDLSNLYDELNALVPDIELLYPAEFGFNLVLTPHVYVMNSAAMFTDSIYLDAQGNPDGVFVIKIIAGSPALTTSTYSKVKLINGAQAKNVFWLIKGSVNINNYSTFKGTIVVPSGAINLINTGVELDGRALTMVGAITTADLVAEMPPGCFPCVTTFTDNPQSICIGDSYSFNGNTYTLEGNYNDTLLSFEGCDSIIITQLTVNLIYTTNNPQTICMGDSYIFNGNTYTLAGNYNDTLLSFSGCDSIIVTQLTVNLVYTTDNPQTICLGDSYTINGNTYTLEGSYNDTLVSFYGCDSIIITQLTVVLAFTTYNPQSICNGDSYIFNGNTYTLEGNYNDTLLSASGCDSIIVTQLTVNLIYTTNNPQTICMGDSYTINGNTYTLEGVYFDTLMSVNGCDSVIITQLFINLTFTTNNPQTICNGDSYIFNGNTYTLEGNYNDTLDSFYGCDSVIITELSVNEIPIADATSNSPVCISDSIKLMTITVLGATYHWTNPNGYFSYEQNPVILSALITDSGVYSLIITANGCESDVSTVDVLVNNCIEIDFFIPEGFSPNDDGINDLFVIRGIDRFPNNKFVVYNRWGDKVFEASPYQNTWDGTTNIGLIIGSGELPIATYFYVLDLGDGSDFYKGTIYLNR
jgi:gliding motility-associated-like protein